MKRRATLKDVAKKAGVAVSTVSGIINNRSDSWASQATRKRVFDAAAELDFTPNRLARGLRLNSFELVLLMVPDLTNPFYANLTRRIRKALEAKGYEIIIEETEFDIERDKRIIENLPKRMVDGCIAILSNPPEIKNLLEKVAPRVPIVLLADEMPGLPLDTVATAFHDGLQSSVEHLKDLGHRQIGIVDAMDGVRDPLARLQAYKNIFRDLGITTKDEWIIHSPPLTESIRERVSEWCLNLRSTQQPTALICSNDVAAIATMRGLLDHGIRIPEDISLVGFDNIEFADLLACPLTTVHQPYQRMADRCCDMLIKRIKSDEEAAEGTHEVIPLRLVIRQSTGPLKKPV